MLKPYNPIVTRPELVDRMVKIIRKNDRKAAKPHTHRNARHGRERGR